MIKKKNVMRFILFLWLCVVISGAGFSPLCGEVSFKVNDTTHIGIEALFRAHMLNDQRIQWSGLETTFGVEAVFTTTIQKKLKWGTLGVSTQLFINQPFNKNILADESRQKYLQNFERDTVEVKQLYIRLTRGNFTVSLGKHLSIFGNDCTVGFSNAFFDYPFIRNEAILNFETGLVVSYTPGIFTFDIAVVNGSENMDTNSSKGGMVRIGLKGKNWGLGISAKAQDGIGSEWQKQYKNHAGVDVMFKIGAFRIASEVIYDEYGFHRQYEIDDVFWGRSYYYRDIFYKHKTPITGIGGYLDLQYETAKFFLEVNYGEYYPKEIGHLYHDDPIKRAIVKLRLKLATGFHAFAVGLFENEREKEPLFKGASDYGFLLGFQYSL
ncbi:MAG: hypothetical protein GTO45_32800 [Candidatus Aminicenantes bacterium]|nr:hypothetical protein [Candidatus Aminicenantes bacterium]NIM83528.1 hypothetical protein [Candidatus Aminicenantes bacterium]NIN22917.1 hypothetical protein [Candidatus Aminicenantes bacterium]NIN46656.1 hypothetical protein [Candidatus Aminicenantes bacterium]NIN89562.1 hypothetical protein [Candidatus Aminicenantes bacterium]